MVKLHDILGFTMLAPCTTIISSRLLNRSDSFTTSCTSCYTAYNLTVFKLAKATVPCLHAMHELCSQLQIACCTEVTLSVLSSTAHLMLQGGAGQDPVLVKVSTLVGIAHPPSAPGTSCTSPLSRDTPGRSAVRGVYNSLRMCLNSSINSISQDTVRMDIPCSSMAGRVSKGILAGAGGLLGAVTPPPGVGVTIERLCFM